VSASRPTRVGEQLREVLAEILAREVQDPGIGFITLTYVRVTADLQQARVYYTAVGDEKARRETRRALERATPYLRRQLGRRLRLRRVPEIAFFFDEAVERHERIERILQGIKADAVDPHGTPGDDDGNGD
jgi:ribosome-binding factor A